MISGSTKVTGVSKVEKRSLVLQKLKMISCKIAVNDTKNYMEQVRKCDIQEYS